MSWLKAMREKEPPEPTTVQRILAPIIRVIYEIVLIPLKIIARLSR